MRTTRDIDVFMDVSHETPEQTRRRLLTVIARADLRVFDGTYAFEEFPVSDFPRRADSTARALVRDDETWSQLVPCADARRELFVLFSFHFPTGLDNSGFVGWLASHLKGDSVLACSLYVGRTALGAGFSTIGGVRPASRKKSSQRSNG